MLELKNEFLWAQRELNGYKPVDCPPYRRVKDRRSSKDIFAFVCENYAMLIAYGHYGETRYYTNNKIPVHVEDWFRILNTVDNRIYQRTCRILSQLKFNKMELNIFEETRKTVDEKLSALCPEAFGKLTEIYEDLIESKSKLDLQQIALGCRIVIKDFADAVYPPKNEKVIGSDGKTHSIGDEKYINRIVTFVREKTSSKSSKEFVNSHLEYLESFLKNVNDLANNGAHNEISKEQANKCLIYTYFALGDIINLCSSNLKDN